jgi:flavin reductase (DIM6/NTAB) family NADH-FMN oxidoreductase RutF
MFVGVSRNLAPFSFMNMINYDPPLFTVGFTGCGIEDAKDTLKNLIETRECRLLLPACFSFSAARLV